MKRKQLAKTGHLGLQTVFKSELVKLVTNVTGSATKNILRILASSLKESTLSSFKVVVITLSLVKFAISEKLSLVLIPKL